jgi:hypothetical protein
MYQLCGSKKGWEKTMLKLRYTTLGAIAVGAALAGPAFAGANLVTNGSFEYSSGTTEQAPCQVGYNCAGTGSSIEGWTMDPSSTYTAPGAPPEPENYSWYPGYTFVLNSTNLAEGNAGPISMWVSPGPEDGSNFIAQDAYYHPDAIQQTVDLVNGQEYDLNFYWATAQQSGFYGDTYDQWQVSLGGTVLTTTGLTHNVSTMDTGWVDYNFSFVWTGATGPTVLSFLDICNGTLSNPGACDGDVSNSNGPPFSLLDNVSLTAVPEPSTWAMMTLGFAGLGYAAFRLRRRRDRLSMA